MIQLNDENGFFASTLVSPSPLPAAPPSAPSSTTATTAATPAAAGPEPQFRKRTPSSASVASTASSASSTSSTSSTAAERLAEAGLRDALEQQKLAEWHQREKIRDAEREKRFKQDLETYGVPAYYAMLQESQSNWDAYWTDVSKAFEYLSDLSQKSDQTPPISENAEASLNASLSSLAGANSVSSAPSASSAPSTTAAASASASATAAALAALSGNYMSSNSNTVSSNGSNSTGASSPSSLASLASALSTSEPSPTPQPGSSSFFNGGGGGGGAPATFVAPGTPPTSNSFLAPVAPVISSGNGSSVRRHNSRSSVNSLTSTIFATIGVNSQQSTDFRPRYSLSDMEARFQRIYPEYWSFLNDTHKFSGHMKDFYDTLLMFGFRTSDKLTGVSTHNANARGVSLSSEKFMIDPKELGRTMCVYLRQTRKNFQTRAHWHDGRKPPKMPNAFVQKEIIALKSDRCVHVLNLGDLHGCYGSLLNFLAGLADQSLLDDQWKILSPDVCLVFTGDFADRGFFGVEIWLSVLYLLVRNPQQVFVLKANHEYGAESDFKFDECPLKLRLAPKLYKSIFWRLAETFPDMLFLGVKSQSDVHYYVYSHGAVDPGYVPNGFLATSFKTKYHWVENYDRSWFFEYLARSNPTLLDRIQSGRNFQEIPLATPSTPDGAFGAGPIWNCYQNYSEYEMGRMGNGIAISKSVLEAVFAFWSSDTEEDLSMTAGGTITASSRLAVAASSSSAVTSTRTGTLTYASSASSSSSSASSAVSSTKTELADTATALGTGKSATFKGGSMREKHSNRISVGFGSLRKTLRLNGILFDPKDPASLEAAANAADGGNYVNPGDRESPTKDSKDRDEKKTSWWGKLFKRKKGSAASSSSSSSAAAAADDDDFSVPPSPAVAALMAKSGRSGTFSGFGTFGRTSSGGVATLRHRRNCKTPIFHMNVGGHEHGKGLEIDPLVLARESSGYAPLWRLGAESKKFLVYKFFNMQDLVYYKLNDVSYGRLSIQVSQDKVQWSMEADPIQDVLGLYESSIRCRSLFNSKYSENDFESKLSM